MGMQWAGRQRLLVAALAFVISLVATVVAGVFTRSSSSASAETPIAVPSPTAPQNGKQLRIGLAFGDTLTWKSDQDLAIGLDDAVELGATWIRVDLSWNNIQPDSPKSYLWQRFDRVVKAAHARKLEVLPTIGYTPGWARTAGCTDDPSCPPAKPDVFAAFARDAAQRYAPMGIHVWEIWNEPNIPFWAPKPDAAAYTRLLTVTSKALRGADPKAYLLLGGLAAVSTDPSAGHISHTEFLEQVCRLGGNKLVDALSYHPYTYPHLPSAKTEFGTAMEEISSAKDNLVAVLDKYGTPNMPIWITETGAPTNGPGGAADGRTIPPNASHVTEGFQADIASDTIPAAAANPHVTAVFWFAEQDAGTAKDKKRRSLFYGLRRYDGSRKPAFQAFKDAAAAYYRRPQPQ
ncbi:cellulase (glycosyl hydrolase family 5) [Streptomyces sp. TLI_235]|nr:cellulase family glycosylhydrolase [Streptomyces sp. TLI_235]PBC77877.1 cellulase (glycosyl hydrolase family 5) [Streptomyces sp. TLI_235]